MISLLAVAIGGKDVLILALALVAGVASVMLFSKVDDRITEDRLVFGKIGSLLERAQFTHLGPMFSNLSVGTARGLENAIREAHTCVTILNDPAQLDMAMAKVVTSYLSQHRNSPDDVAKILKGLGIDPTKITMLPTSGSTTPPADPTKTA